MADPTSDRYNKSMGTAHDAEVAAKGAARAKAAEERARRARERAAENMAASEALAAEGRQAARHAKRLLAGRKTEAAA